jgi:hypothetical protein
MCIAFARLKLHWLPHNHQLELLPDASRIVVSSDSVATTPGRLSRQPPGNCFLARPLELALRG